MELLFLYLYLVNDTFFPAEYFPGLIDSEVVKVADTRRVYLVQHKMDAKNGRPERDSNGPRFYFSATDPQKYKIHLKMSKNSLPAPKTTYPFSIRC